jgi:hypothetical protein
MKNETTKITKRNRAFVCLAFLVPTWFPSLTEDF